jgi:hypothetical protein
VTQADLERRLMALERHTAGRGTTGAVGLSSAMGAASTNYRDHFPVILTSTFDSLTGYDWDRLILDRGDSLTSVVEVDEPQSGQYAVTIDNNEGLTVGTRGWLMVDPNAGGWILLVAGEPAGSSPCNTGCGSLVGLLEDSCTRLELVCASGEFAEMDETQFAGVYAEGVAGVWTFQVWDDGGGTWVDFELELFPGDTPLTPVIYTGATDTLTAGGIELKPMCFGESATFAGGPQRGFDGDAALRALLQACDSNDFVVRVSCNCCVIDGWEGEGWYVLADCVVAELLDGDECVSVDPVVIVSGRYDTESEANAAAGICSGGAEIDGSPCCACVKELLTLTVTGIADECVGILQPTYTLTYDAINEWWESENTTLPDGEPFIFECVAGAWQLRNSIAVYTPGASSCEPFEVVFTSPTVVCDVMEPGVGPITFTVTGFPCG